MGSFEIGCPSSRGWKNGQGGMDKMDKGGWGVLKIGQFSWTSFVYHP